MKISNNIDPLFSYLSVFIILKFSILTKELYEKVNINSLWINLLKRDFNYISKTLKAKRRYISEYKCKIYDEIKSKNLYLIYSIETSDNFGIYSYNEDDFINKLIELYNNRSLILWLFILIRDILNQYGDEEYESNYKLTRDLYDRMVIFYTKKYNYTIVDKDNLIFN